MAVRGNQFWKLRSKHGRDKIFETPQILWEACIEYFEATDKRKWKKGDWVGKDAKKVTRTTETPYTLTGLALFLGVSSSFWRQFRSDQTKSNENKDPDKLTEDNDFLSVITRVEEIIYTQKFEGAVVGEFNANIISRDLGLVDRSEIDQTGTNKIQIEGIGQEELDDILKNETPEE